LHLTIGVVKLAPVRTYGGISAIDRVAARRARLLDAAVECYGTNGYAATGVKDICRQAGVTDRYFYESFANRAELFVAAFEHAAAGLLARVAVAVATVPAEPSQQARAAIETFVRALADDPRTARLLFVEPASVGADVERHVRSTIRGFADLVATTARPHVPPSVPDQVLAMGALSLVGAIGLVVVEWLDGNLAVTVDDLTDYFVEMFLVAATSA
jgi:AcrR family transcriptional regulator